MLVGALVLTGLSMRTAVSSVGAALDDVEHGLGVSSGAAGLITTLPVVCFAGLGALTPRLATRFSIHRLLVSALVLMTLGLGARASVHTLWLFLVLSLVALAGGAVANITLPIVVKRDFPDRIGRMTAVYTTALAVGATAASAGTVPIGDALGSGDTAWRFGIGSWAVLSALAVLPWLSVLGDHAVDAGAAARRRAGPRTVELARSPTAWALMLFFAFQSFQAYVGFGWYAAFLRDHGIGRADAGYLVAVSTALSIPVSMIVPTVPARRHRPLVLALGGCYLAAYLGLALAPSGGAVVWMVLAGIGSGMFPLSLTMVGLRARTAATTGALSAFVQSIGYLVAGTGPLLFGVLHGATHAWTWSLTTVFVALAIAVGTGWIAARPCYVDDEIGAAAADLAG